MTEPTETIKTIKTTKPVAFDAEQVDQIETILCSLPTEFDQMSGEHAEAQRVLLIHTNYLLAALIVQIRSLQNDPYHYNTPKV